MKGGERVVDLAEVNSRVFVNNVSLTVYAEAVQRDSYRDAKLRTLADTVPAVLGPADWTCTGPGPMAGVTRRAPCSSSQTIPTGWGVSSARAPVRASAPASLASR
jgi:hypothetical protein